MHQNRTIALVDWVWVGHHPTYFVDFALAIAELGFRVVPFCANPSDFLRRLETAKSRRGTCCSAEIERAQRIRQFAVPFGRFMTAEVREKVNRYFEFTTFLRSLKRWEQENQRPIDFAFFACIYDSAFEHFLLNRHFFRLPWAGLYLHAHSFRMPGKVIPYSLRLPCPEKIFKHEKLVSVAVLDEGAQDFMKNFVGNKPVVVFPDVASNETLENASNEHQTVNRIVEAAAGRPIVSLLGYLKDTKGIIEFTKSAQHPKLENHFFLLAGPIAWNNIPNQSKLELQEIWRRQSNIMTYQENLSEPLLNSIICETSVLFAAYNRFPNSSNILTKAALFEKPIIVSDGYLMAERCRKFALGEVVPEGDISEIVSAILKISGGEWKNRPKWSAYRELHSYERLKIAFQDVLSPIFTDQNSNA